MSIFVAPLRLRSLTIPRKVKFVPLDASERFTELQKRKVDVLSRNSTWNLSRETNYALHFAAVSYYDGQGFMVPQVTQRRERPGA